MPDAGVGGVHKEEIDAALVGWKLRRAGMVDYSGRV